MAEQTSTAESATVRLGVVAAASVGVLALAGAVAVGHLMAGFVGANASPVVAVGNTFIAFTPNWLKDFAVRTFGTADKMVLLIGMSLVLVGVAVAAGLASRMKSAPGLVLAVLLGLVGVGAVVRAPDLGLVALLAPLSSLVVGVLGFRWLHARALAAARSAAASAGSPAGHGVRLSPDRRRFLVSSAVVAAGAALAGGGGQVLTGGGGAEASRRAVGRITAAEPAPPIPPSADFSRLGTPTFLTPNPNFYRVDTALSVPHVRAADWRLRVHGMVGRELVLRYDDLRRYPLIERTITMTCVSNDVGGDYVSTANFVGVRLRDVLRTGGVRPGADQLFSSSVDGWTAGTPMEVVLDPGRDALLVIGMNGEPLPVEHGFPVRMVVPGLYGYISATKWVVDLEATTFAAMQCYWVRRGWGVRGPIKTESRIDAPAGFARVKAGPVTVAGIAWAQPKGIERVEVRVNRGSWQTARLSTEVNGRTWRMWQIQLTLDPGLKFVECRATDRTGYTQTDQRVDPIPDGATGWHSRNFTVEP